MAVQASPAEIEAGALSTEKLRRLVEGFNTRGCTPLAPQPHPHNHPSPARRLWVRTPTKPAGAPRPDPPHSQTPCWAG